METRELLDEVRMRLLSLEARAAAAESGASSAKAAMDAGRERAEAAEKRAQDAEESAQGWRGLFGLLKAEVGESLAPSDQDVVLAVRALKTRCEGAERVAGAMDGSAYVRVVELERDAFRTRALAAESALAERNQDVSDWKVSAESWEREAASLRAQLAPLLLAILGPDAAVTPGNIETAISVVARMDKEVPALRAQVESLQDAAARLLEVPREVAAQVLAAYAAPSVQQAGLRGGAEPAQTQIALYRLAQEVRRGLRHAEMDDIIASLPSPSSPWLTCSGCAYWHKEGAAGICSMSVAGGGHGHRGPENHCSGWTKQPNAPDWFAWCDRQREYHWKSRGLIAALQVHVAQNLRAPSPSPKAGRWKCRSCSHEISPTTDATAAPEWFWSWCYSCWMHRCSPAREFPGLAAFSDHISDAPEVTP